MNNTTAAMRNESSDSGTRCHWDLLEATDAARNGKIAAFSLVLIVSLIGNILVILVVYKNKNMRKTINYFIVNMAASDIIIPVLVMPMQIARTANSETQGAWLVEGTAGLALCKIVYFLADISGPVSILSLVCMAVDRFVGVVFPLRAGLISSRARVIMIAMTWVISFGFYAPYLYIMTIVKGRNGLSYCGIRWSDDFLVHTRHHQTYFATISLVFFIIPLVLLVFFYGVVLITLGKRKFPRLHQSNEQKRRNRRVSRSATVIALTIVLVFQFCWGPYNTITFLWAYKWDWVKPKFCGFKSLFFACQFLTWANAAINPCIYFILVENYRKGLRTVIPRTLSVNSSLRAPRSGTKQETAEQVIGTGDCLELVDQ